MNILSEVTAQDGGVFTFLDGGILQVQWMDKGGTIQYTHYSQVATDGEDWREGVRAPEKVRAVGAARGCSLAADYFQNEDGWWFLRNPNSAGGVIVSDEGTHACYLNESPYGYVHQPQ